MEPAMSVTTLEDVNDLVRLIADRPPADVLADIVGTLELMTQCAVMCTRLASQVRDIVQAVDQHGKITVIMQPDSPIIRTFRTCCELGEKVELCS